MNPDELADALRIAIGAVEAGGNRVTGDFDLWMFAGIHPLPGETVSVTVPVRFEMTRPE